MPAKRLRYSFVSLLCVMVFLARPASAASGRRFSLSLSGGLGYLADPDWFRETGTHDRQVVAGILGPQFSVVRDGYGFERVLPELYLEAACRLTSRLSLGLGVGYVSQKWTLDGRFERRSFIPEDTANFNFAHDFRLTYVPVYLFALYDALRTRTSTFGLEAAASLDILTLDHVYKRDDTYFSRLDGQYKQYWETVTQDGAKARAVGMKIGLFGERRLTDALAMFVTVGLRISPLGEVYGPSVRSAILKSNDKLIYDRRETRTRESVQPGHGFVLTGPLVRGGLKVSF